MTTRRAFIETSVVAASSFALTGSSLAQTNQEPPAGADYLFVQSAKSMAFDHGTNKLTLVSVSPATVFFSDRPERVAGKLMCHRSAHRRRRESASDCVAALLQAGHLPRPGSRYNDLFEETAHHVFREMEERHRVLRYVGCFAGPDSRDG